MAPDERVEADPTPGMIRERAIDVDGLWAGVVRTAPGATSGWHHHGDYETSIYVARGTLRMESGPAGAEVIEAAEGDFLHVPRRAVHRETNGGSEESHLVVVRAGHGVPTVNVDGPAVDIAVRAASEADLDRIVDLAWDVAAEGRWIGVEVPFDRPARRQRYAEMLTDDQSTVLIADASEGDGPQVVGQIWVTVAPYGVADIGMLLADGWRGRGIGRRLLDAAIAWARAAGAHKMALEVWPHNEAAIALYRRAGFVEEGRKRHHYRRRNGEVWDAVLMGLPLDGSPS